MGLGRVYVVMVRERWGVGAHDEVGFMHLFEGLKRGGLFLFLLCTLGSGCTDESFSLGGPLVLSMTAVTSVAVTDSLIIDYSVVGRNLLGMEVNYGDMQVDSLFFLGAQTAGGRLAHLYAASGQYTVSARVEDAVEGSVTEVLAVTINP